MQAQVTTLFMVTAVSMPFTAMMVMTPLLSMMDLFSWKVSSTLIQEEVLGQVLVPIEQTILLVQIHHQVKIIQRLISSMVAKGTTL